MYVEYNLINNIPILYPDGSNNFKYAPRYPIATADKLLHCFDKGKNKILIKGNIFRYIKVNINKSFDTLQGVKALYYYVLVDNSLDWDGFDYQNINKMMKWLKQANDNYILITTPILLCSNSLYSIANDHNISIIHHTNDEIADDNTIILKLIDNNCYTICDNYNIAISFYQENVIDKSTFIQIIKILNHLKNFYYTSRIWMYLINHHRILSACDFPILYLCRHPNNKHTNDLMILFDLHYQINNKIYLQTYYNNDILYTSFTAMCYPQLPFYLFNYCNNTSDVFYNDIQLNDNEIVKDYYGFFATLASKHDHWTYWLKNRSKFLSNMLLNIYDVLCSLFKLYTIGFEGVKIQKKRIRHIWNTILANVQDNNFINQLISITDFNVPYVFLVDVWNNKLLNIDYGSKKLLYDHDHILRYTSLYSIMHNRMAKDSIYYFHFKVQHQRIVYILMCIYRKFGMSKVYCNYNKHKYLQGYLIIDYLQKHMYYLVS